jgi:hypothetical protein
MGITLDFKPFLPSIKDVTAHVRSKTEINKDFSGKHDAN